MTPRRQATRLEGGDPARVGGDAADREAIERVLDGERDAFASIVRRHGTRVYRIAFRFLRNNALADEAAQETFTRAYSRLGAYRGEQAFHHWLYRITTNLCRDLLKSASTLETPIAPTDQDRMQVVDPMDTAENRLDRRRALQELQSAITQLPAGEREAFVLRVVENLSYAEMGEILGATPNALKVRVHRARGRLKRRLGSLLNENPEES